jgi:hypothetical protein
MMERRYRRCFTTQIFADFYLCTNENDFGNKVTQRAVEKIMRTTEKIPLKFSVALLLNSVVLCVTSLPQKIKNHFHIIVIYFKEKSV